MAVNLMDFLTRLPPISDQQEQEILNSPEFLEWVKLRSQCDALLKGGHFVGGSYLSGPEEKVLKKERTLISEIWHKYHFLPLDLQRSVLGKLRTMDDMARLLSWLCNAPLVKFSEIRDVAEKLSFMVLPITYVNSEKVKNLVWHFSGIDFDLERLSQRMEWIAQYTEWDCYVLCPAGFYDARQAEQNRQWRDAVFFGGELAQLGSALDIMMQIRRNLFLMLNGRGAEPLEVGAGGDCSENELKYLKVMADMMMPIQRSLVKMIEMQDRDNHMISWQQAMREESYKSIEKFLQETSQQLSWSEEARKSVQAVHEKATGDTIVKAAAVVEIVVFAVPRGSSIIHDEEGHAKLIKHYDIGMTEEFYANRGFCKKD